MIDPSWPKPIHFDKGDTPELTEIADFDLNAEREADRQRKEEDIRWLNQHYGFQPFGQSW